MAELDKKMQKSQTDLVQSVVEAYEKKNSDRVDMLITNAIKQLKMSRFKPDLTTCLSLTYLARTCPKVFQQSNAIKDVLKSLLRRDGANIKGKNEIVLPILAANIMLACCDSPETRLIVLQKIDGWVACNNQRPTEMVLHLFAILCKNCQADQATINYLVELRVHWLNYMEQNFDSYGPVPTDLCASLRKLLHSYSSSKSLIPYLNFLVKHDQETDLLTKEISKFIIERPITLANMFQEEDSGILLKKTMLRIFIKHLDELIKHQSGDETIQTTGPKVDTKGITKRESTSANPGIGSPAVIVKKEPVEIVDFKKGNLVDTMFGHDQKKPLVKEDAKPVIASEQKPSRRSPTDENVDTLNDENKSPDISFDRVLHVKLIKSPKGVPISWVAIEAILTLLTDEEFHVNCEEEFLKLSSFWTSKDRDNRLAKVALVFEDESLGKLFNFPERICQRLVQSEDEELMNLGLGSSNLNQLIKCLQLFGSPLNLINNIIKSLLQIDDMDQIRSEIKDLSYFNQLLEFYSTLGASGAKDLRKRIETMS